MPRPSKQKLEDRILQEMFREWMDELVAECDICRWGTSRAESHALHKAGITSGCLHEVKRSPGGQILGCLHDLE